MSLLLSRRTKLGTAEAPPPGPVSDDFNRADNASSMGSTSVGGKVWVPSLGTWGIASNQAYCSVHAGFNRTTIDNGVADCTIEVTLPVASAGGLCFRYVDANNYWLLAGSLSKFVGGSLSDVAGYWTLNDGDVLTVILAGNLITFRRNGTNLAAPVTDSSHATATKHGLFGSAPGTTARYDAFSVTP